MDVSVSIPDVPLLNGTARQVFDEETRVAMEASVLILQSNIVPNAPVGVTGAMRAGVQTSVTGTAVDLTGRVYDNIPYAIYVEQGRRPGKWPPRAPILLWVKRKLGVSDEKRASFVAYCISKKIHDKGIAPVLFFERGRQASETAINARWQQAEQRIVLRLGGDA